jgi:PAB-dependent poly(A)-specific ribonuclease subunit 3
MFFSLQGAPWHILITWQLDYHLYTVPLPDAFSHNYFMSDTGREELQRRTETLRSIPPGLAIGLPEDLQGYHSLVALESPSPERRRFGNWLSTVYKANNSKDGATYVLRRIEG